MFALFTLSVNAYMSTFLILLYGVPCTVYVNNTEWQFLTSAYLFNNFTLTVMLFSLCYANIQN